MIVPDQSMLVSTATLKALSRRLYLGEEIAEREMISLLPTLGYWGHVTDQHPDPGIQNDIEDGLGISNIWDRFDEIEPEKRWLYANHQILDRHPAAHSNDRLARAALVSLNPHLMQPFTPTKDDHIGIDFIGLGGCDKIGASSYAYRIGRDVVLVDIGIDPDTNSLPSFELLPPDWIADLRCIVLTHLHADHAAGLLRFESSFNRLDKLYIPRDLPIYCTETTAQLFYDVLRMSAGEESWRISDPAGTINALSDRLHPIPTDTWHRLDNYALKLIDYPHVPGSALLEIESPEGRLLHAVDYAESRSLGGETIDLSWLENEEIKVVVLESTYGQIGTDGHWRQLRIPQLFTEFVNLLGADLEGTRSRVLFPAFSLGRAQELGDILEEQVPGSTILDGAAGHLSSVMHQKVPFWKRQPVHKKNFLGYRNIVASHGWMLDGSASHSHYEVLNGDDLVVFTGYIKPSTPAARTLYASGNKPRVVSLPMSAHASLTQLLALVEASGAGKIILVHGAPPASREEVSIDHILEKNRFETYRPVPGERLAL